MSDFEEEYESYLCIIGESLRDLARKKKEARDHSLLTVRGSELVREYPSGFLEPYQDLRGEETIEAKLYVLETTGEEDHTEE